MNNCIPSIDEKNPLYCPKVTATAYLDSLRRRLRHNVSRSKTNKRTTKNEHLSVSFACVLDKALLSNDSDDESNMTLFGPVTISPSNFPPSPNSSEDNPFGFQYDAPSSDKYEEISCGPEYAWVGIRGVPIPDKIGRQARKRKRTSFSDILGSPKYAKSIQSVHDSSFDVIVKREKLDYSAGGSVEARRFPNGPPGLAFSTSTPKIGKDTSDTALLVKIQALQDELYGPSTGTESPRGIKRFIENLDGLLPGVRLKERLSNLDALSHQRIVDFLGLCGYLNTRVMNSLRTSEIRRVVLTESLADEDELNLCGRDVLRVFGKPNSFLFLSELFLSDTHIRDFDITHIHHLPKLSTLLLNNTAISNEAIYLLIPLKRSLTQLSVAVNPNIDDDAVPALLLLSKLSFLSILDTSIDMPGVRRLAKTIYDEDRIIDIEIPSVCEHYIDNIHTKYLLDPLPPLICNPKVCQQLSAAALQRNLAAHAAQNPDISDVGSKAEMAERLQRLLENRKMDLMVRDMILGPEEQ